MPNNLWHNVTHFAPKMVWLTLIRLGSFLIRGGWANLAMFPNNLTIGWFVATVDEGTEVTLTSPDPETYLLPTSLSMPPLPKLSLILTDTLWKYENILVT